jgi:hypothetical protein
MAALAERARKLIAIKRECGCADLFEANEILNKREHEERQAKADSFFVEVTETGRAFDEIARALPQHKREVFLDLSLKAALGMAIRHFAPRVRGHCERRPRSRAVRRRSGRTTRAGPSDPDEPEPPRRRRLRLLHNGHEPRCGARGFALFRRPRPSERPEKGGPEWAPQR